MLRHRIKEVKRHMARVVLQLPSGKLKKMEGLDEATAQAVVSAAVMGGVIVLEFSSEEEDKGTQAPGPCSADPAGVNRLSRA